MSRRLVIFAMELDRLSDKFGILFVVAAGNYVDEPIRTWPNPEPLGGADLISSPESQSEH